MGQLFGPVLMNSDIFYLFKNVQKAQMQLFEQTQKNMDLNILK
jgi:hypothetical protein